MKRLALAFFAAMTLCGCAGISLPGSERQASTAAPVTAAAPQDQTQLYFDVVEGLIRQKRYGAAVAFLDGYAMKEKEIEARYWLLRGDALLGLNRTEESLSAYMALDNTALAAKGWNGKGEVAALRKQWRDAAANFREAVRVEPSNPDFLNNLAFADMHIDQSGLSAGYLRQALELKPDSSLIRNNLLIALTLSGDREGADAILKGLKDAGERAQVQAVIDSAVKDGGLARDENP
jgi:Flp pilus assembly protein TadD